jgi:hypothetical protein
MLSTLPVVLFVLTSGPVEHRYDAEIAEAVGDVQDVFPVPATLVKAVIKRESNFNPQAISPAGAIGLMQLMPYNAEHVGVHSSELWVPSKNILAGVRLLAVLLAHYQGDLVSALVAYNAGPRRPFAPIPQNGETPSYVTAVIRYWREFGRRDAFAAQPIKLGGLTSQPQPLHLAGDAAPAEEQAKEERPEHYVNAPGIATASSRIPDYHGARS